MLRIHCGKRQTSFPWGDAHPWARRCQTVNSMMGRKYEAARKEGWSPDPFSTVLLPLDFLFIDRPTQCQTSGIHTACKVVSMLALGSTFWLQNTRRLIMSGEAKASDPRRPAASCLKCCSSYKGVYLNVQSARMCGPLGGWGRERRKEKAPVLLGSLD